MKFLRHILSHIFLIFFLLAIISVFYYRTLLLPNDLVGEVDSYVNNIYPPAVNFASKRDYFWSIKGKKITSFDELNLFNKNNKVNEVATAEAVPVMKAVVQKTLTVPTVTKTTNVESKVKEKIENKNSIVITEINPQPSVIAEMPDIKQVQKTSPEVKDKNTSSERDLLINARNAFIRGNHFESEKIYIELTQLDQDGPDAFGELGNVYYSQGKWDEAGQAYYEAAVRLIAERKYNQVAYLQQVIKGLNSGYAEKLSQQMLRK